LAFAFATLDASPEASMMFKYLLIYGGLPVLLFALYCVFPRPAWAVFLLSAITSALSIAIIGGMSIVAMENSANVTSGGYEWLPLAFVMFVPIALIGILAFHYIIRVFFGRVHEEA
jgi:hypothetical protein